MKTKNLFVSYAFEYDHHADNDSGRHISFGSQVIRFDFNKTITPQFLFGEVIEQIKIERKADSVTIIAFHGMESPTHPTNSSKKT